MAVRMTAQEARDGFAETLNRVAYGRTRVLVERRGKPLAAIVPVEDLEALERRETPEVNAQAAGPDAAGPDAVGPDEEARRAAIRAGRGMLRGGRGVDDFLRERHEETEREEENFEREHGKRTR